MSLKNNQPKLLEAVESYFRERVDCDIEDLQYRIYETTDAGHGRIDERSYGIAKVPVDFAVKSQWPNVKAIGYSVRMTTHTTARRRTTFGISFADGT